MIHRPSTSMALKACGWESAESLCIRRHARSNVTFDAHAARPTVQVLCTNWRKLSSKSKHGKHCLESATFGLFVVRAINRAIAAHRFGEGRLQLCSSMFGMSSTGTLRRYA